MRRGRNKLLHFFVCICILFFIIFYGQVVHAAQQSTDVSQASQNDEVTGEITAENNLQKILGVLSIIFGASVFSAIGTGLVIKNYFDERSCDLDKVHIELLDKKPNNIDDYTVLECGKIEKDGETIEIDKPDYHYYDVSIDVIRSPKKKIDLLIIKELIIEMNDYRITYVSKECFGYKDCKEHIGRDKYSILMIPPSAKDMDHQDNLSAASIFINPNKFKMYISFYMVAKWRIWYKLKRSKSRIILFEKEQDPGNVSGLKSIIIKSKSIKKGRLNNG